ncbi:MAG: hypothetical protein ABDH49_02390 [Candidatus Hydrothermales bacterium]
MCFPGEKRELASLLKDGDISVRLPQHLNFLLLEQKMQDLFNQFVEYFKNVRKNNIVGLDNLVVTVTPKIYQMEKE